MDPWPHKWSSEHRKIYPIPFDGAQMLVVIPSNNTYRLHIVNWSVESSCRIMNQKR